MNDRFVQTVAAVGAAILVVIAAGCGQNGHQDAETPGARTDRQA